MTLGTGVVLSTLLIIAAVGIYQISVRGKWKIVGRVVGILLLCIGVLAGIGWGWYSYANRPSAAQELEGVRLGMTPVQVTLARGEPTKKSETAKDKDGEIRVGWTYQDTGTTDEWTLVMFFGRSENELKASIVCRRGGYTTLHGLGRFNSEGDVLNKLGQPTNESIHKSGLSKIISFASLKTAYTITKGQVSEVCVTDTGAVTYADEYASTTGSSKSGDTKADR
jgi:hypothetical protein